MPHGIYKGKQKEEIGNILAKSTIFNQDGTSYLSPNPLEIRAVFKRNKIIWPSTRKYKFWAKTVESQVEFDPGSDNRMVLTVKAGADAKVVGGYPGGPINVDIFLRSCSQHAIESGVVKYGVRVESLSSWCTIDDDTATSKVVSPTTGDVVKDKADAKFSLHIQPNYGSGRRTTRIRMYQLKEATDNSIALINGEVLYIDVVQEGDVMVSIADYSNAGITLYTSSTYNTIYTDINAKEFAAKAENGVSEIFFRITGAIHMQSGNTKTLFFGENGEELLPSYIRFNQSFYIASIYDISSKGGNCTAKIKWNTNTPIEQMMTEVMRDFTVTPSSVSHLGGQCIASFYLYKIGTSTDRSTLFTISIPTSTQWIGSKTLSGNDMVIWQEGDVVTVPITDATPTISVNQDAKEYVGEDADLSIPTLGYYSKSFNIAKQTSIVYSHIEDVQLYILNEYAYKESVPYVGGDILLRFKIYANNSTYLERSFVISAKYNELGNSNTIVQQGSSSSQEVEVTSSNYPTIANNIIISNISSKDNPVYVEFLSNFSTAKYLNSKWQVTATVAPNLHRNIDKMIVVSPIYGILSSDQHTSSTNKFPIDISIVGGEVNSDTRYDGVKIVCDDIGLDDQIDVQQSASGDAQQTTYYDNIGVVVTNTTDNLTCTVDKANTATHIYEGWVECKENNNKAPGVATVIPSEITSWSVGTVKNDLSTVVFVQVKGYPGAKGQERTIKLVISAKDNSCDPINMNAIQDGKDQVIDYNDETWVTDLNLSSFTLTDDSQASLMQVTSPIYTGSGWYAIPIKIDDNTTPTYTSFSLYIGNEDMRESNYMYTISEYKQDNILTPISASWTQTGDYVTRSATLNVANLIDLPLEWTQVPYNGNQKVNSTPNKDYEVKIDSNSDWLTLDLSSKYLIASKNMTTSTRSTVVSVRYKNGSEYLSDWVTSTITQACMLSSDELGYTIEANPTELTIDEVNGQLTLPFSVIKSVDYQGTVQRISASVDQPGLLTSWTTIDGECRMAFASIAKQRTSPKLWKVTISQLDNSENSVPTGKTAIVTVKQPRYGFALQGPTSTDIVLNYNEEITFKLKSIKVWPDGTIEEVPFTITQSDYDWLTVTETSNIDNTHTYSCSVYSINKGENNRSVKLTLKQSNTNEIKYITITEPNWKESEFDESKIDVYHGDEWTVIKPFWSIVNEKESSASDIRVRWDSETVPTWVNCEIKETKGSDYPNSVTNNGNLCAVFTCDSILEGTVPLTDVIKIDNGVYGIGSCRVTKHAFIFNVGFEKNAEGINVIYVSATATKIWSMYYVDSRMDNQECPYTCTSNDKKCTIKVSGNAIEVFANTSNNSNTRKTFTATIQQEYSKLTKQIAIIQLTKEDEADYDFYY